jgi:hypothetical protein
MLAARRLASAAIATAVSVALTLAFGAPYGASNQATYLVEPLRRAVPALYAHDWLVSSTTMYHPVFAWLAAPLYAADPDGRIAFALAQLVVMALTWLAIWRLVAALTAHAELAAFACLAGLLALNGGRALGGSYLFAGYLQPSSLASLGWLVALLAWARGRTVVAGVALALAGICHVNFLVLGVGVFGLAELASRRLEVRRLAALLGPSLLAVAIFAPALIAAGHADDPAMALRILTTFHAPGHYAPVRVVRWLPPLIGWLIVAWGARPAVPAGDAPDRIWRFAAAGTVAVAAAALISLIPPFLGVTRLFLPRVAPFAQLASQLLIVVAALAPAGTPALPRRRVVAILIGAAILVGESIYLGGGHYTFTLTLGLVAAVGVARWRSPRAAAILAPVTLILALAQNRHELVDPPLFGPECDGANCTLQRWARTETPVDAVFVVPPYLGQFRLLARRAVAVDTKSPPLYPDELIAWYRRLCDLVDARDAPTHEWIEHRWPELTADQLTAAARHFHADYLVIDRSQPARPALPVAHEDESYLVYRVP